MRYRMIIAGWLLLSSSGMAIAQQDLMIDDAFPYALITRLYFPDDLIPEPSAFSFNDEKEHRQRDTFSLKQLRAAGPIDGYYVRMIAIDNSMIAREDQPAEADYAVIMTRDNLTSRIVSVQLPIPTSWHKELDDSRRELAEKLKEPFQSAESAKKNVQRMEDLINQRLLEKRVETCEAQISDALAERIDLIWRAMVMRTRYSDGTEGITRPAAESELPGLRKYGFDFHFNDENHTGWINALYENTRPDLLVSSGLAMRDYCRTKDPKYLTELNRKLTALEKRLPRKALRRD